MTAARCLICEGDTDMSEIANIGKSPARRRPLVIEHEPGCCEPDCWHTVGTTYVTKSGLFRVVVTGAVEITAGRISVGFHRVRYPDLKTGPATILCAGIIEPNPDPHPDCPGEFHGADGGACDVCGWDSHPIAGAGS